MAQMYAYGDSKVRGCPCVAKAHGGDLRGELLTVAEMYDTVGRERHGKDEGKVNKSTAEEMWNEAIRRVKSQLQSERSPEHARYLRRAISQAEDMAQKAF